MYCAETNVTRTFSMLTFIAAYYSWIYSIFIGDKGDDKDTWNAWLHDLRKKEVDKTMHDSWWVIMMIMLLLIMMTMTMTEKMTMMMTMDDHDGDGDDDADGDDDEYNRDGSKFISGARETSSWT